MQYSEVGALDLVENCSVQHESRADRRLDPPIEHRDAGFGRPIPPPRHGNEVCQRALDPNVHRSGSAPVLEHLDVDPECGELACR